MWLVLNLLNLHAKGKQTFFLFLFFLVKVWCLRVWEHFIIIIIVM